jgi:hypothetical protein
MIVSFSGERIEASKAVATDFTDHHARQFDTMTYADRSMAGSSAAPTSCSAGRPG